MKTKLFTLAAAIGLAITQPATAATKYWSGTGTWNATNTNWGNATTGPYNVSTWGNATADVAVFEGTAGIVTVGQNLNVGNLTFTTTGYSLIADAARTLSGPSTISVSLASGVTASIGANITFTTNSTTSGFNLIGANQTTSVLNLSGTVKNLTANNNSVNGLTVNINTGGLIQSVNSLLLGTDAKGAVLNIAGGDFHITPVNTPSQNLILNNTGNITASSTVKISAGNLTFTNSASTGGIRFGSTVANSNPLTQLAGTVDLDGGTVTVYKVYMGNASYTGGASYNATFNFNGGTLKALANNNTDFMTGLTGGGAIVKAGGAVINSNGFSVTIGQALLDGGTGGNLTKTGLGALSLSGANTYTGGTFVNQGALAYLNKATVPVTGSTTVADGAAISLAAISGAGNETYFGTDDITTLFDSGSYGNITVSTTGSVGIDTTPGNLTYSYGNATTRGLAKTGANTLTLTGNSSYSGPTSIYGGTLQITAAANLGDNSATNSIVLGSGTLQSVSGNFSLGTNRGILLTGTGGIQVDADTVTVDGVISGSGGLTKTGAGTLVLTGVNTHTGTTTVSAGALQLSGTTPTTLATSPLALGTGSTLQLRADGNTTFTSGAITAPDANTVLNINVDQLTGAGSGKTLSLGNMTVGTNNSAKTINVTGGNGYSLALGDITDNNNSGGMSTFTINATTAPLTMGAFREGSFGSNLKLLGTNAISIASIVLNSNANNTVAIGSGTDAPVVTISGATTKTGGSSGLRTLGFTLNSGATFNINNAGVFTNPVSTSVPTFVINGGTLNNTSGSAITLTAGTSSNPTQTWNADFAFTGSNDLSLGTGAVTLGTTAGATRTVTVNAGNLTVSGVIANGSNATTPTTALAKVGSGTLILGGSNTYNGVTTITAGTLVIAATGNITSSAATVNGGTLTVNGLAGAVTVDGGTLSGNGTVGAVIVNAGGTLAPGNSPGVLSASSLSLNGTTILEINGTATRGTDFDGINITTSASTTYGGNLTLAFGGSMLADATINLFSFTGGAVSDFSSVSSTGYYAGTWIPTAAQTWQYNDGVQVLTFDGATGNMGLTAIPEPKTWALIGLGLGFTLFRMAASSRRRRRLSGRID